MPGQSYLFDYVPIEIREDTSFSGSFSNTKASISNGASPALHGLGTIFLVLALISGILFAVFYFKARSGFSFGGNSAVKH